MFCEGNMCGKFSQESSCVSGSEEYSNSQPVAEPRAIPEERQRGTVILTRSGRVSAPALPTATATIGATVRATTTALPISSNKRSIHIKKTVTLLYHVETFTVNTVRRCSTAFSHSASYPREQIKYLTFAGLIPTRFSNKPQVKGSLKNGLGFY